MSIDDAYGFALDLLDVVQNAFRTRDHLMVDSSHAQRGVAMPQVTEAARTTQPHAARRRIRLRAAVTTAVDQGWRCWLATRQRHAAWNWIGVPCPAQHCIICNVA